jgi:hypothetical protein
MRCKTETKQIVLKNDKKLTNKLGGGEAPHADRR